MTPRNVLKNLKDKWLMGSQNFFSNQNKVTYQIESKELKVVSTIFRCTKIKTSKYVNPVTIIKSKLVIIEFGNHKIIKYCLF